MGANCDGRILFFEMGSGKRRISMRTQVFVENYLSNGGNATKAARDAGYRNAQNAGYRNLRRPEVRGLLERRLESAGVSREEVVGTLVTIMRHNTGSPDAAMVLNALRAADQLCKVFGLGEARRPKRRQINLGDDVTRSDWGTGGARRRSRNLGEQLLLATGELPTEGRRSVAGYTEAAPTGPSRFEPDSAGAGDFEGDGAAADEKSIKRRRTTRSEIFTRELLSNGGDASKAARAAGFRNPGSYGPRMAGRPETQALIRERIEASAVGTDDVLMHLMTIMRENADSQKPAMVRSAIAAGTQLCKLLGL